MTKNYEIKNGVMVKREKKSAVRSDNWTRFDKNPRVITVNGREAILL